MARANTIQTNFTAGEISPAMWGRVDVQKYYGGARKLMNMIVQPQGGIYRRPGTSFCTEAYDPIKKSILKRFVFSETQAFIFELTEGLIRILYNGELITQVLSSGSIVVGHHYTVLTNTGSPDWTNVGAANNNVGTTFTATGTVPTSWGTGTLQALDDPIVIPTPYLGDDLAYLRFTQPAEELMQWSP